jgi:hypothetical protein
MTKEQAIERTESIGIGRGKYTEEAIEEIRVRYAMRESHIIQSLKTAIYEAETKAEKDKAIEELAKYL